MRKLYLFPYPVFIGGDWLTVYELVQCTTETVSAPIGQATGENAAS